MFSVIFEVRPRPERWEHYLAHAALLRPELLAIDGFIDNVRYRSLCRPGWILSLSTWRDEKAVVRWRTHAIHHAIQGKGRDTVFEDYHLRVGQVTADNRIPAGHVLREQRLDATNAGAGRAVTIVEALRPAHLEEAAPSAAIGAALGLREGAAGIVGWDVFDAIHAPGDLLLMVAWRDADAAAAGSAEATASARLRSVRVIRDYGMFDRREAPQYWAPRWASPATTA